MIVYNLKGKNNPALLKSNLLFLMMLTFFLSFPAMLLATTPHIENSRMSPEENERSVAQQQIIVAGKVTDDTGATLPGVSVKIKGLAQGTATDANGAYSLAVPSENVTLEFSYIGFTTAEYQVGSQRTINVQLRESTMQIDEVVVIGYGTQKKVNLTGAVDVISEKTLANRAAATVSQLVQGASPNLDISLSTLGGEPGAGRSWNLRGTGSINSDASPLILVDGMETSIDRVDPESIESISILKDASASAIYGSRAPFGVILVTTKRGKRNQPVKISYSNNISINTPLNIPHFVDTETWMAAYNQACVYGGVTPVYPDEQVQRARDYMAGRYQYEYNPDNADRINSVWQPRWQGNANYDWPSLIMQRRDPMQMHNVNVEGGGDRMNFYISTSLMDQPGLYTWGNDYYKRYNVTANVSAQAADWLTFNISTKYANTVIDRPDGIQGQNQSYFLHQVFSFGPMTPRYLADGETEIYVPLVQLKKNGREVMTSNDLGINLGATLEPIKGWKTNINYNYRLVPSSTITNTRQVWVEVPNGTRGNVGAPSDTSKEQLGQSTRILFNATTSYEKQIASHYFRVMAGYEQEENRSRSIFGSKADQITQTVPSISTGLGMETLSNAISHWAVQGVFGRVEYNFAEKYLLELSGRRSGSSRFPEDTRWGFFPSAALGYVISNESFWEPVQEYVNFLKLRGSYGSVGNQNVANYLYIQTLGINNASTTGPNLWNMDGVRPNYVNGAPGLISPNITWETIRTLNLGADASFLNNRLSATYEWYNRKTVDMLGPGESYPGVLGASAPRSNNAEMETKGFEMMLNWKDKLPNGLAYNVGFSLGDYQSKILKYNTAQNFVSGWYPGKTVGEYWGYVTDGIMQTQEEVDAMPNQSYIYNGIWRIGDMKYKDLNGDGKIDQGTGGATLEDPGDLKVIANTNPRYNYSITAGASWKDFDFNMFWQGIGKQDFIPNRGSVRYWGLIGGGSTGSESAIFKNSPTLDYWRAADDQTILGPNTDAYFGRPYFDNNQRYKNFQYQSKYVESAAYLRLKSLQIGYTVPTAISQKIKMQRARIYISGENLLTITTLWKSIEPEAGLSGDANYGASRNGSIYPITRSYAVGVNITF